MTRTGLTIKFTKGSLEATHLTNRRKAIGVKILFKERERGRRCRVAQPHHQSRQSKHKEGGTKVSHDHREQLNDWSSPCNTDLGHPGNEVHARIHLLVTPPLHGDTSETLCPLLSETALRKIT